MATLADVLTLARTILEDENAEWATNTLLIPHAAHAYRRAARYLRSAGMGLLIKQSSNIAIAASSSAETAVGRSGSPSYPTDMLRPLALREKPQAGVNTYKRMDPNLGFIIDQTATSTLSLWTWRNDQIVLPPCTTANYIQILYWAALTDLASTGDTMLIPDGVDPVAILTASYARRERGQDAIAQSLQTEALEDLKMIAEGESRVPDIQAAIWGASTTQ